jgi:hypothetical protein
MVDCLALRIGGRAALALSVLRLENAHSAVEL